MTHSDWAWRKMECDPVHDKRPIAMPTVPFDVWMAGQIAEQNADDVATLVDEGWLEADAIAFVANNPREGGSNA